MRGQEVCARHGGKVPKGAANPNYKNGRYSKYMPKHLRTIQGQVSRDPDLLGLNAEVEAITVRISELFKELSAASAPGSSNTWKAYERWQEVRGNEESEPEALSALEQVLQAGHEARPAKKIWEEIRELIQERPKVVAREGRRLHDLNAFLTVDQAMTFVDAFYAAAKELIADRQVLAKLYDGTLALMPPASHPRVEEM